MTRFRAIHVANGAHRFSGPGIAARCALGRGGVLAAKREGDGASPAGIWPLRRVLYRPDRQTAPDSALPSSPIARADGWCDAPADPAYNRPVMLPYHASCERMWRDDDLYDLVIVLGHNDNPPVPGAGSCIFLHLARLDFSPTEGCVAVAPETMELVLKAARPGDGLEIGFAPLSLP